MFPPNKTHTLTPLFLCTILYLQEVGVGEGPRFECVQFGLTARSPLLQNYLFTHGLEERGEGGTVGPVVGRTQISKPPYPTSSCS